VSVDLRLALPAAFAWVVTALVIGIEAVVPAIALWAGAGIATAVALSRPRFGLVALSLAAAALCCTSVAGQAPERRPHHLVEAAEGGRVVEVVGSTTGRPGKRSLAVTLTEVDGFSVRVPALLFAPTIDVGIGTTIAASATLTATDPGDDVAFLVFADTAPRVLGPPPGALDWANDLRAGFLDATRSLPGQGGELLAGLAIGDTGAVSDRLDDSMKVSSLSHLTAVSGANCAIVIGLVMGVGAAVGMPRGARIAASLVMLFAFVVLVTPEPSVLRAAVMATLVLLTMLSGRTVRGVPVLALATLTLILIDPWLSRTYGFVLSVLATAGLLLLAGPIARRLGRWLPHWLALVISVPLAAQLACQPVIILLNAALPTYGVVANLLAAPAAPVATIVGLAACALLAIAPPVGLLLCQLAWIPSSWIAGIATFFAAAPAAQLPWVPGPVGALLLAALSAALVLAVLGRRWAVRAVVVVAAVYLGLVGGSRIVDQAGRPSDWQIAACDVGQGDAVVVRSAGQVALIDTGADPVLVDNCLSELGIARVTLLVLTHYDLDHVGGASALLGRADRVLVGPSGEGEDDLLRQRFAESGAVVDQVSRGPTGILGELRWRVLWPPRSLAGLDPGNSASVVLEFTPVGDCSAGCLGSLFLGDLGDDAQGRLLRLGQLTGVDVVKVAHHGSADQNPDLYGRLAAIVGVIGVGAENGYGHPTSELMGILAATGTTPVRTDLDGLILLAPGEEPGTVRVWTQR